MTKCLKDYLSVSGDGFTVFHGSNLDVLPLMADNSVDSIVTDPPYELGFMGKSWDSSGIAYSVELWRECLRVLKPGGHLLAFSGSRTYHRMVVAIEDSGFEIRDMVSWISNKTFPKSLDISKAIDKAGATEGLTIRKEIQRLIISSGLTDQQIAKVASVSPALVRFWRLGERSIQTAEAERITKLLGSKVPPEAEREVIGQDGRSANESWLGTAKRGENGFGIGEWNITAAATDDAKKWSGWGTALKPSVEPIVMARKPLIGTVAQNVLTWGVGGLNIDGSRIGTEERVNASAGNADRELWRMNTSETEGRTAIGRWPANIILDEYTAELLDEQADASRFFYVAKASKRDRNEGLDELPAVMARNYAQDKTTLETMPFGKLPKQNFHPTVKPTDLMRYLIKLVTPAGGLVLDPFTGSGSTGKAALLDGYKFTGIELTADYLPIIEGRLKWAAEQANKQEEEKEERLF